MSGLTDDELAAITEASFAGGAKAWRAEVESIITARIADFRSRAIAELRGFDGEDGHPGEFIAVNEAQGILRDLT